jgi:hypothetical protein
MGRRLLLRRISTFQQNAGTSLPAAENGPHDVGTTGDERGRAAARPRHPEKGTVERLYRGCARYYTSPSESLPFESWLIAARRCRAFVRFERPARGKVEAR